MGLNTKARISSSVIIILIMTFINPIIISFQTGNPVYSMTHKLLFGIVGFDLFCLLSLLLFLARTDLCIKLMAMAFNHAMKFILSKDNQRYSAIIMPVFFAYLYFYHCITSSQQLPLFSPVIVIMTVQAALLSCFILISIVAVIKIFRGKFILAAVSVIYFIVVLADWIAVTNGGGRFAFQMLGWVTKGSVMAFLNFSFLAKVLIIMFIIGGNVILIFRYTAYPKSKKQFFSKLLFVSIIFYFSPGHWLILGTTALISQGERTRWRDDMRSCELYFADPILRLPALAIANFKKNNDLVDLVAFQALERSAFGPGQKLAPVRRHGAKRIIFILVESFSLNLIKSHNGQLPESITPFLDSIAGSTRPIWTCSTPTTPGLATHFCSHPNAWETIRLGYPHSVVRRLRNQGWRTVFFESPYETFDEGIKRISDLGFSEHYGALWQLEQRNDKYVKQWGTCDRWTFHTIVNYLDGHRNERVFLAGLTIDTHFPVGRTNYSDLDYPDEPKWTLSDPAHLWLRSVYRFDYDLKLFVGELKAKQLLDNDTVLIITADHSCPPFPLMDSRLGVNNSRYEKIPWIAMSGDGLPILPIEGFGSQLDSAPTIAYLAGITPDPAWWGNGLQFTHDTRPLVSRMEEKPLVLYPGQDRFQPLPDAKLANLSRTFVYDNDCPKARAPR